MTTTGHPIQTTNRYFATCAFLGTEYVGWQRQENGISVQGVIEKGLSTILQREIEIVGCGRTDAGVHARNYVFHFDTDIQTEQLSLRKINRYLPDDIVIHSFDRVAGDAHARFSALSRSYEYWVTLEKDPFHQHTRYYYPYPQALDIDAMEAACAILLQFDSFKPFCKTGSDTPHYLCDIEVASWAVDGDILKFNIIANRFLRGMVRLIVGTMLQIGQGKMSPAQLRSILSEQSTLPKPESAPAHGLHFVDVRYGSLDGGVEGEL